MFLGDVKLTDFQLDLTMWNNSLRQQGNPGSAGIKVFLPQATNQVGVTSEGRKGKEGGGGRRRVERQIEKGIESGKSLSSFSELAVDTIWVAPTRSCLFDWGLSGPSEVPWAFWRTTRRSTLSLWTFASSSPATLSCFWSSWFPV